MFKMLLVAMTVTIGSIGCDLAGTQPAHSQADVSSGLNGWDTTKMVVEISPASPDVGVSVPELPAPGQCVAPPPGLGDGDLATCNTWPGILCTLKVGCTAWVCTAPPSWKPRGGADNVVIGEMCKPAAHE